MDPSDFRYTVRLYVRMLVSFLVVGEAASLCSVSSLLFRLKHSSLGVCYFGRERNISDFDQYSDLSALKD